MGVKENLDEIVGKLGTKQEYPAFPTQMITMIVDMLLSMKINLTSGKLEVDSIDGLADFKNISTGKPPIVENFEIISTYGTAVSLGAMINTFNIDTVCTIKITTPPSSALDEPEPEKIVKEISENFKSNELSSFSTNVIGLVSDTNYLAYLKVKNRDGEVNSGPIPFKTEATGKPKEPEPEGPREP